MIGNRFGNYPSIAAAETDLQSRGFSRITGVYWRKDSTDVFGFPCVSLVKVVEQRVDGCYTASGKDEPYYQHEYHPRVGHVEKSPRGIRFWVPTCTGHEMVVSSKGRRQMVAVFILKNGAWVQHGNAVADTPANRATLRGEVAYLVASLGVTAKLFKKA